MDLSDKKCRAVIIKTAIKNLLNSDDKLNFLYDATLNKMKSAFVYAENIQCTETAHDSLIEEFNEVIEALVFGVDTVVDNCVHNDDDDD